MIIKKDFFFSKRGVIIKKERWAHLDRWCACLETPERKNRSLDGRKERFVY